MIKSMLSKGKGSNIFSLGEEIFSVEDDYGVVKVFDSKHKRILTFGSVYEQCCLFKSRPHVLSHEYTQAMMVVLLFATPQKITVFGLGGGALVHCLLSVLPNLELKAVELRAVVIQVARDHFFLPVEQRFETINQDAFHYLHHKASSSTDMLFSDIYLSTGMDLRQATKSFVKQCRRVLTDQGWLVCNIATTEGVAHTFIRAVLESFGAVYISSLPSGNMILYACVSNYDLDSKALGIKAKAIQVPLEFALAPFISRLIRFS